MAVRLLTIIENKAIRVMAQEPDLNVKGFTHMFQGWKFDKAEKETHWVFKMLRHKILK